MPGTFMRLSQTAFIFTVMSLVACAPREPQQMQATDPARYNHDLAECQAQAASSFSMGNAVTACMQAKGYRVM